MPPPNRARPSPDTAAFPRSVRRAIVIAIAALTVIGTGCGSTDDDPVAVDTPTTVADGSGAETTVAAGPATETVGADTADETDADPEDETDTDSDPDADTDTHSDAADVVDYVVRVTATLPHDPNAYTQGLEVIDGLLVESTGLRGESSIRVVDPATGEPVRSSPLDDELFGEGATVVGDEIWQLTWTSETLLIHGFDDLAERRRLRYGGEGWGLCASGDRLVMSDGSSALTFRDPTTFDPIGLVQVTDEGEPLGRLNELECVDGVAWANVYQTTLLVAIDLTDGRVVGRADIAELVPDGFAGDSTNVANGIAHDPTTGRFYLTGKRWPVLYEVELVPVS